MKKNLNSDLITEQDFYELKINEYKKQFVNYQSLEEFLRDLPYSDEFPR